MLSLELNRGHGGVKSLQSVTVMEWRPELTQNADEMDHEERQGRPWKEHRYI